VTARPEVVLLNFGAALGLEALHIIDDDRFLMNRWSPELWMP
jgi:hypothetical protein